MFTSFDLNADGLVGAWNAGRKGGRAKTPAKRAASRENGKMSWTSERNGRPRTRTLGEFLLRQKLDADQHLVIREAFFRLTPREESAFKEHFGLQGHPEPDEMNFSFPRSKPSAFVRYIIKKLLLIARWLLENSYADLQRRKQMR